MLRRSPAWLIFAITSTIAIPLALAQLNCVGSDPDPVGPAPTSPLDASAAGPPGADADASACAATCDDHDPCTTDAPVGGSCGGGCTHVSTCSDRISLDAVADSTLDESQPTVNTGGTATLEAASGTKQKIALIRFDPFANGRTYGHIDRAVLHLTTTSTSLPFGTSVAAQLVKTAWSENVVTWSSAIQAEGSLAPLDGSTKKIAFDVTPWVQNWNANPASNSGIAIAMDTGHGSLTFGSREDPTNAPKLELIVNAHSVSLPVTQDTYLSEVDPTKNFGTASELVFSTDATGAYTRVLAAYDLRAIPPGATVFYAEAVFKILSGRLITWVAYPATATWGEQVVTWKTTPTAEATATGTMFLASDGRASVDVTSALVRWISGALPNNGLLLKNDQEDTAGPSGTAMAGSRESTTPNVRPTLEVLYR